MRLDARRAGRRGKASSGAGPRRGRGAGAAAGPQSGAGRGRGLRDGGGQGRGQGRGPHLVHQALRVEQRGAGDGVHLQRVPSVREQELRTE